MIVGDPIRLEELTFVLLLSLPFVYWGFKHGLDAVIILAIAMLVGITLADTIANSATSFINIFWRMGKATVEAGFGTPQFFTRFREIAPLIDSPESLKWLGTVLFALLGYAGMRIAVKRAGGRKSIFEGIFGAMGGAVAGYFIVTFLLARHFPPPQVVEFIETQQLPVFNVDATVVVLLVLVIIVFGVQRSPKPDEKGKKEEKK